MTVKYAVTFEFAVQPPVTHKGTVTAVTPGTCARRAVEEAQKALPKRSWDSMNIVFLERLA